MNYDAALQDTDNGVLESEVGYRVRLWALFISSRANRNERRTIGQYLGALPILDTSLIQPVSLMFPSFILSY